MTERLYDSNAYAVEFSAKIVSSTRHESLPAVILDRTLFYPTSGGQPNDLGVLNGVSVLDVLELDDDIVHVLKNPIGSDVVTGRIDWDRRFDHMQQHTGQHILSQSFIHAAKAETIGFHLGAQICTIDLDRSGLSEEIVLQAEDRANRTVMENRTVHIHRVLADEVSRFNLRKAPASEEYIRIVEIEGFDANGCCGTHVKYTGEAGPIKILRQEKYKGGSRITFVCGFRAFRDYQKKQRLTGEASVILNSSEDDIIENLNRWQSERKANQKRLKSLGQQLVQFECGTLMDEAEILKTHKIILKSYSDRTPADLQQLARLITRNECTVVLLGCTDDRAHVVLACHPSLEVDMNGVLQDVLSLIDGRGGGTKQIAQGNGPYTDKLDELLRRAREAVLKSLR